MHKTSDTINITHSARVQKCDKTREDSKYFFTKNELIEISCHKKAQHEFPKAHI